MKKLYIIFTIICTGFFLGSCSEDIFNSVKVEEGVPVTLSLTYKDIAPTEVTVTRSELTDAEEKRLRDLQVFIFSAEGNHNLKGYAHIIGEDNLAQDGKIGDVKVETTSGNAYIYAIANPTSEIYNINGLPANLNSDDAKNGKIQFSLEDFKKIAFERKSGQIAIGDGWLVMSGTISEGGICAISSDGSILGDNDNIIKLRRIVSKVKFDIKPSITSDGTTKSFELVGYEIHKIPTIGNLIKYANVNDAIGFNDNNKYEEIAGKPEKQENYNGFIAYLPENMQSSKKDLEKGQWPDREADGDLPGTKVFTNAPENGTYVVLNGTYKEIKNGILVKDGQTSYTIHLGNFSQDVNDYNNERNYKYTYNITIKGIHSIQAEATKENPEEKTEQPGAEGIVFEYDKGKSYTLDSHYEYCVMEFNRSDIYALKHQKDGSSLGYCFRIRGLKNDGTIGETETIVVTDKDENSYTDLLNRVDINWIKFLKGGTFNKNSAKGGNDDGYKSLYDRNNGKELTPIQLLKHLYEIADNDDEWVDGKLTYTCYIDENFYKNMHWNQFVNKPNRIFYIANDIAVSNDQRSKYAKVAYSISQHSIQTFYNQDRASQINAFGCETLDETRVLNLTPDNKEGTGNGNYDKWDGRQNMIKDLNITMGSTSWTDYDAINRLAKACLQRNRDLNHDGKIDDDEIRWYTPTVDQYTGLWMGEQALDNSAVLFTGKTADLTATGDKRQELMHYYTSTYNMRTYWSEEGMAVGNLNDRGQTKYIRCIRTLPKETKAEKDGAAIRPDMYYTYKDKVFDMSNMDKTATQTQVAELADHHERQDLNKVAFKFKVSDTSHHITGTEKEPAVIKVVRGKINCAELGETGWRVPNQRELAMMYLEKGNKVENKYSNFGLDYFTYCRTQYSNKYFKNSWSVDENLFMLAPFVKKVNNQDIEGYNSGVYPYRWDGYIRCIKVNP